MASCLLLDHEIEIPDVAGNLEAFRRWALSDAFPQSGRIDYIDGAIEVDMSPENVFSHGTLKGKLYSALLERVEELELGHLLVDSSRISAPGANLSAEPDILLVTQQAIDEGRIRLTPAASKAPGQFVELEGAPDLVVEIVSDSSVRKDTERLPKAYFLAGLREFWLVDARGDELQFQIHRRSEKAFEPVPSDADGFQGSAVLSCRYRLVRQRGLGGFWQYELERR